MCLGGVDAYFLVCQGCVNGFLLMVRGRVDGGLPVSRPCRWQSHCVLSWYRWESLCQGDVYDCLPMCHCSTDDTTRVG